MAKKYNSFGEFFPFYLQEHSQASCRMFHYVGTILSTICLLVFAATGDWRFLAAWPIIGYGFAWVSHAFIEKNRPATFTYPGYSFVADYYMTFLWLTGRLKPHLDTALEKSAR